LDTFIGEKGAWRSVCRGMQGAAILLTSTFVGLLAPVPAHAGLNQWTTHGPDRGKIDIRALAIDPVTPTTLYVSTSSGIFKSIDGGASWVLSNNGLTNTFVSTLVIDPVIPSCNSQSKAHVGEVSH